MRDASHHDKLQHTGVVPAKVALYPTANPFPCSPLANSGELPLKTAAAEVIRESCWGVPTVLCVYKLFTWCALAWSAHNGKFWLCKCFKAVSIAYTSKSIHTPKIGSSCKQSLFSSRKRRFIFSTYFSIVSAGPKWYLTDQKILTKIVYMLIINNDNKKPCR